MWYLYLVFRTTQSKLYPVIMLRRQGIHFTCYQYQEFYGYGQCSISYNSVIREVYNYSLILNSIHTTIPNTLYNLINRLVTQDARWQGNVVYQRERKRERWEREREPKRMYIFTSIIVIVVIFTKMRVRLFIFHFHEEMSTFWRRFIRN